MEPPSEELTPRELDVVRATARGLTSTELGQEPFMSLSTVKTHLAVARSKLNARNRVERASWVWRSGDSSGNRPSPPRGRRAEPCGRGG